MQKKVLFTYIILITAFPLTAQPRYTFVNFSPEEGLTSSTIQDMVQDHNGFLWLASWGGLFRFDGVRFINYKASATDPDENPRSERFIQVTEDQSGRIWARAYDDHLYYIDPYQEEMTSLEIAGQIIKKIFLLRSGRICFLSGDNTLFFQEEGPVEDPPVFVGKRLIAPDISLLDIHQDSKGYLWLMTSGGLYRESSLITSDITLSALESEGLILFGTNDGRVLSFRQGQKKEFQTRFRSEITLLAKVPGREEILVGTTAEGIVAWDPVSGTEHLVGHLSYAEGALHSLCNSRGDMWIYAQSGGLDWYDPDTRTLHPFFNPARRSGWDYIGRIASIVLDNQDDIWISSALGGLEEVIFSNEAFQFEAFTSDHHFVSASSSVRALGEYERGKLLVGTRDGGVQLMDTSFHTLSRWDLPAPPYTLTRSSEGTVWVGTRAEGLFEITPDGHVKSYRKNDDDYYGAVADHIYSVREDAAHRLWIASFDNGLSYLDLTQQTRAFISKKNLLTFPTEERNRLRCIAFDDKTGKLFTGGDIGLFVCDNADAAPEQMQFRHFTHLHKFDIPDILLSKQGKLYVCSYGNGFLEMDSTDPKSAYRAYTVEDGLLSNFILAAQEDENGVFWIATEGGLNRFDPVSGNIVGYSYERLGFPMRFSEGAILKDADGKLYFNTNVGVFFFDPARIAGGSYIPELQILSFRAGKRPVALDGQNPVRLRAGEQINLTFTAIDMAAPGHIQYSYRIDGTDDDWVSIGTQHELTLGPFRRGRHQVLLRSTNGAGVTVDNVRTLEIQALPHPLASTPAVICYLLCAVTAGMVLLLRRRRRPEGPVAPENPYLRGLQGDDRKLIEALLALLESKLDDGALDMDAMAEEMHLSRSALFKKTKALTGKSPMDLLHEMRSARARELVASGGYTIAQIAYMTGFNDAHYFSRIFKKETGMTPTEYRNQNNTQP